MVLSSQAQLLTNFQLHLGSSWVTFTECFCSGQAGMVLYVWSCVAVLITATCPERTQMLNDQCAPPPPLIILLGNPENPLQCHAGSSTDASCTVAQQLYDSNTYCIQPIDTQQLLLTPSHTPNSQTAALCCPRPACCIQHCPHSRRVVVKSSPHRCFHCCSYLLQQRHVLDRPLQPHCITPASCCSGDVPKDDQCNPDNILR